MTLPLSRKSVTVGEVHFKKSQPSAPISSTGPAARRLQDMPLAQALPTCQAQCHWPRSSGMLSTTPRQELEKFKLAIRDLRCGSTCNRKALAKSCHARSGHHTAQNGNWPHGSGGSQAESSHSLCPGHACALGEHASDLRMLGLMGPSWWHQAQWLQAGNLKVMQCRDS